MYDKHPIRLSILHMAPDVAESRNIDLARLLSGVGLDGQDLLRQGQIALRAQVVALLQQMARRAGDATLGLDLAAAARPAALGTSGEALLCGRTVRECLQAQIRHMPNLQAGARIALRETPRYAHWCHSFANSDPEQAAVLTEGVLGFCVRALRVITGQPELPVHVLVPHRQSAPMRLYEEKLGCALTFRPGSETIISFDAVWLDHPNMALPPHGLRSSDRVQRLDRDLAPLADDQALRKSLHLIFEIAAMSGRLSLMDSAMTLGIAPRSLQRRLAHMDSSFEALVDEWRHNRALMLMMQGEPIHQIAARLGYTHHAHFTRAFGRWQGMAPSRYRERMGTV